MQQSLVDKSAINFEVYHPPLSPTRLLPIHSAPKNDVWRPSIDYKHKLLDVRNQYTPSEYFRHRYRVSGPQIRMAQKLESRWYRHYDQWNDASILIQKRYRGVLGRERVRKIRIERKDELERKRLFIPAKKYFLVGQLEKSLEYLQQAPRPLDPPMQHIEMKALYRLQHYEACILSCQEWEGIALKDTVPYYYEACSYAQLQNLDQAYEITRNTTARFASCPLAIFRLHAALAVQLHPPQYDAAIESYTELIKQNNKDFEAFLGRACCYNCLQEWSLAVADINVILAFQPTNKEALLLRARLHSCIREWALAKKDFELVLYHNPTCEDAKQGLADIMPFNRDSVLYIET